MQTAAPCPASFLALIDALRAQLAALAARLLSIGGIDPAQSRSEALTTLGRMLRNEFSVIGYGDHVAFIGASLVLMLCLMLYLIRAAHLQAALR